MASPLDRDKLEEAAALVARATASGQVHSAGWIVRQAGSHPRSEGADKIFLIASITKPMTAAGMMLLVERGELKLTDPASKYLPEFTEGDRSRITIQQLLTHVSGLPDQLPENVELRQRQAPLEEFVERAQRTPLLFAPGEKYSYSSMAILLTAEIAQRLTERPFREFLREEIFVPLGMERTFLGLGPLTLDEVERSQVENAEPLYGGGAVDPKSWDWNSPYWRDLGAPWGGAHSTAADIAVFLEAFLQPERNVLKPETARLMIQDHGHGRGLGFVVRGDAFGAACSANAFGHSGSTGTLAWAEPATETVCVILTTLPARVSNALLLKPFSQLVCEAAA